MSDISTLILGTAFADNLALDYLLGLCPLLAVSRKHSVAAGMALATLVVLPVVGVVAYIVDAHVLRPLGVAELRLIVWVALVAALSAAMEGWLRRHRPLLHQHLGVFLPLLSANCLVLGMALLMMARVQGLFSAFLFGLGTALGIGVVLLSLASLRERLTRAAVPEPFRGAPIALITLGMMALAWSGLEGVF